MLVCARFTARKARPKNYYEQVTGLVSPKVFDLFET